MVHYISIWGGIIFCWKFISVSFGLLLVVHYFFQQIWCFLKLKVSIFCWMISCYLVRYMIQNGGWIAEHRSQVMSWCIKAFDVVWFFLSVFFLELSAAAGLGQLLMVHSLSLQVLNHRRSPFTRCALPRATKSSRPDWTTTWDIISTSPLQCTEALHVAFLARRTFEEAQFHFLQFHLLLHLYVLHLHAYPLQGRRLLI